MLENIINLEGETKETIHAGINNMWVCGVKTIEVGNLKVENNYSITVGVFLKQFNNRFVLCIEDWDNTDGSVYVDDNIVNVDKLVNHLKEIGLIGLANSFKSKVDLLDKTSREDVEKMVENSEELKLYFKDFYLFDKMSEEEKLEFNSFK